jgi:indolepyruvate ferredoxin oxidoreductase
MDLLNVALTDKYQLQTGRVFLNGTQALVRLVVEQRRRDQSAGLNTAGYVSGYRGSPLGGMDKEFNAAAAILQDHQIKFHPAVNEDLAATALWGSQQVGLHSGATHDGVFGLWYGKGPGVDRSGDVFRHANLAGTAPLGGVLALFGDDPACKSSTVPSQSEHAIIDAQIPLLNPVDVCEVIDYGLLGWAMSRYSGCWTGLKCITDNIDSSASVLIDPTALEIVTPTDFEMPDGGLSIRWPDPPVEQEFRLHQYKVYAALAFARANALNRVTFQSSRPRFGIVATGKAYLDTLQALTDLGIDAAEADRIGLRLLKIGMPWPLEPNIIRDFAEGLTEVVVIEEKRAVIENQLKEQLYNWDADKRPRVVGKFNEAGEWILPSAGELTPARIARVIAERLKPFHTSDAITNRLNFLEAKEVELSHRATDIQRLPYFCSGCPHSTSTKVPEGSRAAAGIGCHYMVLWMDRDTETFTHMGAEGANWIGQAPFTETPHIFANIGDGTYFHSGIMAIRAAVAANVNITYKILYNDAVAMTGGQTMDGPLDVPIISRQIHAEGVERIAVVSDEPDKYPPNLKWAPNVSFHDRHELDAVQREMRELKGVTAIIYDQTCAAEKRRRRKRGTYPDPAKRAFINELVCEGCGDCGVTSNCVSVTPKETELGRKRAIDQSSCNKDFTCVDGFCPSFVTVHGAGPRKPEKGPMQAAPETPLPAPTLASATDPYGIVIGGIGGTGVVTISALLAMAAHVAGKGVTVLDVAGLAQKNGAVYAHIRICDDPNKLHAVRIAAGGTDLLLGCDMVTAGGYETLSKLQAGKTRAVINAHQTMTADFTADPDLHFPVQRLTAAINEAVGGTDNASYVEATELARALLGDTIAANLFIVGYAYQKGLLPLSEDALNRAIELNGVAVDFNKQALQWGRRAAHDPASIEALLTPVAPPARGATHTPTHDSFITARVRDLTAYQNIDFAVRYTELLDRVTQAETTHVPDNQNQLTDAVARSYFKLLAIKDEYEVARLYTDGRFEAAVTEAFEDGGTLKFHLAPPLLAKRDSITGLPLKKAYGPWVFKAFKLLAKLKALRGTPLDIFGKTVERRRERQDITDFEALIAALIDGLTPANHATAVKLAELPLSLRGFGHIKDQARRDMHAKQAALMRVFLGGGDAEPALAAE